jgi:hypothetical protein
MALQLLENLRQQQSSAFAYFDTFLAWPRVVVIAAKRQRWHVDCKNHWLYAHFDKKGRKHSEGDLIDGHLDEALPFLNGRLVEADGFHSEFSKSGKCL